MKRFYREVTTAGAEGGWRVLLDGKPLRSVGGRAQVVPAQPLAEALAEEWARQGEEIDPAGLILRDMADYAIDVVGPDREAAIRELLPYGETDTLCYRAPPGDPLRARQEAEWEPLLRAAEARLDVHFERIAGIIHRPQPAGTMLRLETVLGAQDDFVLAALRNLAGLAASLVIGLGAVEDDADPAMLWDAAQMEERWQAERWGSDADAAARLARRRAHFLAAAEFAVLARGSDR